MSDENTPPGAGDPESDGHGDEGGSDGPAGTLYGVIEPIEIQEEMEQSFLEYAMSVIMSRALPDVRDGLKPVHRRILWAMDEANVRPNRSHVKCATVVGDVIGKYHPHGDQAVYDALVRMGQSFSLRDPLIDPHGNFGSPADPPAAYRYTECRLAPIAMHLLADIEEDTVDFSPNFDGNHDEPIVLPARFPNLLVNGSQGIAVGMATNIPPHNLGEVIDAVNHLLDNPEASTDDLMAFVKGPDFPTGGLILGRQGIFDAYRTGRGSIKLRAKAEIVEGKRNDQIVVTEIPYQTSVEQIETKAAELVDKRELDGIRDIRNESAKGKTRLVFELKRDAPALVVLNNLYKHTPLQTNFSVNMVALVDGVPRTLSLRDALVHYVDHQIDVITRRSRARLADRQRKAHIREGLIRALDMIDQIIALIRSSEDKAAAMDGLMAEPFSFSDVQADHILEMPLRRLTRLARADLEEELEKLRAEIAELEEILANDVKLRGVIRDEITAVREEFASARRSPLTVDTGEIDIEDLVEDEDLVVTMTKGGYIKRMSLGTFRTQGRGGRGVAGTSLKDEDVVSHILHTTGHAYLLFFSNRGRVYRLKAYEIPMMERTARGTAIVNLLPLQPDERIQAIIDTRDYETNPYLLFVTRQGQIKKTRFNEYDSSLRAGLIAINLRDGDELVRVLPTDGDGEVMIISQKGMVIRFGEDEVRSMGRSAAGVRGMRLREGDVVVGCDVVRPESFLLIVTDHGYGKRTNPTAFNKQGRGGQGVKGIRLTRARGNVIAAFMVGIDDEIFVIASGGVIIRTEVRHISAQGRDATGVRVMNLEEHQLVAGVAPVLADEAEEA
ncbi:MAG: DNA gyrase subunit A [Actinomycetota bacterium]|nr:DNA gyrase subunit A [Actinomycetota bacterium]